VLKVFDVVHGLEAALLARGSLAGDLPGYLAVLAQLEAALRLLADNCGLAAQWLADIVAYLGERDLADPRFVVDLAGQLERLKTEDSAGLVVGLLASALGVSAGWGWLRFFFNRNRVVLLLDPGRIKMSRHKKFNGVNIGF